MSSWTNGLFGTSRYAQQPQAAPPVPTPPPVTYGLTPLQIQHAQGMQRQAGPPAGFVAPQGPSPGLPQTGFAAGTGDGPNGAAMNQAIAKNPNGMGFLDRLNNTLTGHGSDNPPVTLKGLYEGARDMVAGDPASAAPAVPPQPMRDGGFAAGTPGITGGYANNGPPTDGGFHLTPPQATMGPQGSAGPPGAPGMPPAGVPMPPTRMDALGANGGEQPGFSLRDWMANNGQTASNLQDWRSGPWSTQ